MNVNPNQTPGSPAPLGGGNINADKGGRFEVSFGEQSGHKFSIAKKRTGLIGKIQNLGSQIRAGKNKAFIHVINPGGDSVLLNRASMKKHLGSDFVKSLGKANNVGIVQLQGRATQIVLAKPLGTYLTPGLSSKIFQTFVSRTTDQRSEIVADLRRHGFEVITQNSDVILKGNYLASGSFKDVFRAINLNNFQQQAFAEMKMDPRESPLYAQARVANEIRTEITFGDLLRDSPHFLPSTQITYQGPDGNKVGLMSPYANGGDLYHALNALKNLSADQKGKYAKNILDALRHMKEKGVVHGDLKTENLLIANDEIKVVDFGFAQQFGHVEKKYAGTPGYIAPETLKRPSLVNGSKADEFAVGMILLEIATNGEFDCPNTVNSLTPGAYTFPEEKLQELREHLQAQQNPIAQVIAGMIDPDPHKRWDVNAAIKYLGEYELARLFENQLTIPEGFEH